MRAASTIGFARLKPGPPRINGRSSTASPFTICDLRHDFAHRAREAGWSLEEIAYYLGHVTKQGTPAIGTTARYTQVSREHVRDKLGLING